MENIRQAETIWDENSQRFKKKAREEKKNQTFWLTDINFRYWLKIKYRYVFFSTQLYK